MNGHPAATDPAAPHEYKLRVYYEDTDAGGVVYHAGYLRFAERARTEVLRAAGATHAELQSTCGLIFVVRRIELRYLRPARLDDEVSVVTGVVALGGATVRLRQVFRAAGRDLAVLRVELACVRVADGRPARIPARWRDVLAGLAGARSSDEGVES